MSHIWIFCLLTLNILPTGTPAHKQGKKPEEIRIRDPYVLAAAGTGSNCLFGSESNQAQKKADPGSPVVSGKVVFEEKNGICAVEAEHFYKQTLTEVRKWYRVTSDDVPTVSPDPDQPHLNGASGDSYIEILPDMRVTANDKLILGENFSNEPGKIGVLHYRVKINTPGRYYIWVRSFSEGAEDNGLHTGFDGTWPDHGQRMQWCEGKNEWTWAAKQRTTEVHCSA